MRRVRLVCSTLFVMYASNHNNWKAEKQKRQWLTAVARGNWEDASKREPRRDPFDSRPGIIVCATAFFVAS